MKIWPSTVRDIQRLPVVVVVSYTAAVIFLLLGVAIVYSWLTGQIDVQTASAAGTLLLAFVTVASVLLNYRQTRITEADLLFRRRPRVSIRFDDAESSDDRAAEWLVIENTGDVPVRVSWKGALVSVPAQHYGSILDTNTSVTGLDSRVLLDEFTSDEQSLLEPGDPIKLSGSFIDAELEQENVPLSPPVRVEHDGKTEVIDVRDYWLRIDAEIESVYNEADLRTEYRLFRIQRGEIRSSRRVTFASARSERQRLLATRQESL
ncbi:hypothetical protein [Halomarina pelagica]|uniref:hypothetical protein n=1 Tax=Halomarina pelagica TaxID=2961599 RepID=UPI0020C467B1|nr:hypothetical protein [Halomarina sp. BND7]